MYEKNYLLFRGEIKENTAFLNIRKAMERIAENLEYKIDRYSTRYFTGNEKTEYKSYLYNTPNKQIKFDTIPIDTINLAMFQSFPVQADVIKAQLFICMSRCLESNEWSLSIVWWDNPSKKLKFEKSILLFKNAIESIMSIRYLVADSMEDKKEVEMFLEGVLFELRTELENSIAYNIQQARLIDDRLPFLFPYTLVMKGTNDKTELCFSQLHLLNEPVENYAQNPQWAACYRKWMEEGIIAPLVMEGT